MTAGVKCAARMVGNRLFQSCKARRKPFINEKQRRVRSRFAKDHKDWSKVIVSDESNFQLGRLMVRRRPGKDYKPQVSRTHFEIWWRIGR